MIAAEPRRRWPLLAALLAAATLAALVFSTITVRSDLADLLPQGRTQASRVMLEQLRAGPASSLILIGIEHAAIPQLAAISTAMAATLHRQKLFKLVGNGQQIIDPAAQADLFAHRYLLSPATTAQSFEVASLHRDFANLLQALASSASPVIQQYGMPDPTGTFLAMAGAFAGSSQVRSIGGVWFAKDRDRALMLAQTSTSGLDLAAEDQALAAIRSAFQAANPGTADLLLSGPAVFAHDAAHAIKADVRLLSVASSLLVAALLFWRFRSLLVVAVIAVPLLLAAAAGALAVQAAYGFVHGITLGFGMTMLGVAVDYPVLLIGHRKEGEPAHGTLLRIGATFNLAVATAALGLTGMLFSSFPGLSQLGLFSVAGLLTAAATTRLLLPRLIVAASLAPVGAGDPALLARVEPWRSWRLAGLLPIAAALLLLAWSGGPRWDRDLAHLSPVPAPALALDAELRRELGAPEAGQILMVEGHSAETVLQREEALLPTLDRLTREGAIAGADAAARLLPSQRTQRARQNTLPDGPTLAARVTQASAGLGFTPGAFQPFLDGVAVARMAKPLGPVDLPGQALTARLGALLFAQQAGWVGLIAPQAVRDTHALASAFGGPSASADPSASAEEEGLTYVDVHSETNSVFSAYTQQAWPWLAAGAAAAMLALAVFTRDPRRLLCVLGSIAATLLVTIAALMLFGANLSLIHVMALQFVAGIGLDYALFFSRPRLDQEERSRTLRTLLTCNGMALLTFGLLCLCHTPLLRDIGQTVATGVFAAMVFAFLFAGPLPA